MMTQMPLSSTLIFVNPLGFRVFHLNRTTGLSIFSVFSIVVIVRRNIFWFFIYHFLSRFFSIVLFLILFFCNPLRLLDLFLRPLCTPPHAFFEIELCFKLTLHYHPERHSSLIWGVVWPSYIIGISSSGAANLLVSCGLASKSHRVHRLNSILLSWCPLWWY
jgi:hypothetical protein